MEIIVTDSYEALSQQARDIILKQLALKNDSLICAATGSSPTRTYELLAEAFAKQPQLFSQIKVIKLDEWGNIPMEHPKTCESYLQQHVIPKLKIDDSRYISFLSNPDDPKAECNRIRYELEKQGPIDLCILGLGMNGHIALNEPAEFLQAHCHVAELSPKTLQHPMAIGMEMKPTYGLTLGMADIMHAKHIVLIIHGEQKKAITKALLSGNISTSLPASLLWLHPNVTCLIEKEAME